MLDIILNLGENQDLDIVSLKQNANTYASKISKDDDYDKIRDKLKDVVIVKLKGTHEDKPAPKPAEVKAKS